MPQHELDPRLSTLSLACSPQVSLSYERSSTIGFAIMPVSMDFAGGVLSVSQQVRRRKAVLFESMCRHPLAV